MSFLSDTYSGRGWHIRQVAICPDVSETKSIATLWRRGNRGTGIQVRTKVACVKALGAVIYLYVVVEREKS